MYFVFLALWIVLNGKVTVEIISFGLVIAAALYWFICKLMYYSNKKELLALKKIPLIFLYFYYVL